MVPTDISSSYDDSDQKIIALIAAATAEVDGPDGWLGRAIGPQTIELQTSAPHRQRLHESWHLSWCLHAYTVWLPCPPIVDIVSVTVLDYDRNEVTIDPAQYELTVDGLRFEPGALAECNHRDPDALRIRYDAGYNGTALGEGGTGDIPQQIKQAVALSVQYLSALGADNLFVASETVQGVGQTNYVVSPNSETLIRNAMDRMLSTLRVYR